MKINIISTLEWRNLVAEPSKFLTRIQAESFIVRGFVSTDIVDEFREFCINFAAQISGSWHPCVDGCPDYHRIHERYEKAYVKSIQHGFYFHSWNSDFKMLCELAGLKEIFEWKSKLAGFIADDFINNIPSDGPIARVVCHQYPSGGGGQDEHIDPVSPFAKVQTIIQASSPGIDYLAGGLYINDPEFGVVNIDPLTKKGDLILISPGVRHGVAPIDPGETLRWDSAKGRWIIMPIIINSDYINDPLSKPFMTEIL